MTLPRPREASLIGAPTDVGAAERGASLGPEALRVAEIEAALAAQGLRVKDCGNLIGPANPGQPPYRGYRHLSEVVQWNRLVYESTLAELRQDRLPILLGGDHSLSIGSISAVARHCRDQGRGLRVLWLDAHTDFNTCERSPTGNLHGMPLACLCGFGPESLCRLGGEPAMLEISSVRQVGARSVDRSEKRFVQANGLQVFDMRCIDERGMRETMACALDGVDRNVHLHVSFDVDFLDPTIAPGVGTTVSGGPSYREAQLCMEMIADTGALASLDIVELNSALDTRNATARVAVEMVESLFGKSTLERSPLSRSCDSGIAPRHALR